MLQLKIIVEVDPELANAVPPSLAEKLARGIRASPCRGGVRVDGLPGMTRHGVPVFASCSDAVMFLYELADIQADGALRLGGGPSTATGRYMLDRAMFLRLAAAELLRHRCQLWIDAA